MFFRASAGARARARENMHIKTLKLYNFRNLKDCTMEFSPGINFIYGNNGQGKTNIVEAISFLSWGRSFRTSSPRELVTWGEEESSVFAEIVRDESEESIGISIKNGRKTGYLNGDSVGSLSKYLGKFVCVSFSPSDLMLVQGAPKERRSFIDRHLTAIKPELIPIFSRYSKALKSKNKLLKEGVFDRNIITPWNQVLAESGSEIFNARLQFLEDLSTKTSRIHQTFGETDGELYFSISSEMESAAASEQNKFLSALEESFHKEQILKKSILGPHKDDFEITLEGKKARSFASQGQCRSIVLSMVLAATEIIETARECSPVILLDDVDSELDPGRAKRFFEMLWSQERQICITGTSPRILTGEFESRPKFFEVSDGEVVCADEKKIAI